MVYAISVDGIATVVVDGISVFGDAVTVVFLDGVCCLC